VKRNINLSDISYEELKQLYRSIGLELQKRRIESQHNFEKGCGVTSQMISKFFKNRKVVYNLGSINILKKIFEEDWSHLYPSLNEDTRQ
jgi:hypothetical protein